MSTRRHIRKIAKTINEAKGQGATQPKFRKARVSAVNVGDSTVDINIVIDAKSTEATIPHVACLAAYTPRAVNDAVWFVQLGRAKYLCLGKQG